MRERALRWIGLSEDDDLLFAKGADNPAAEPRGLGKRVEDNTFHLGWRNLWQQRSDEGAFFG